MNNRGSLLIIVSIFLTVFVIMSATIYRLVETRMFAAVYNAKVTKALYLAYAGIEDGVQILKDNPSWPGDIIDKKLGEGSYDLSCVTDALPYQLIAKGKINSVNPVGSQVQKKVKVLVDSQGGYTIAPVFNYVIAGQNNNINANAIITGNTYQGILATLGLPVITENDYLVAATAGGTSNGNTDINNSSIGPRYITGSLTLSNNVTINGTIFVENGITINGNARVQGKFTIYSKGNVHIRNGARVGVGSQGPLIIAATNVNQVNIERNTILLNTVVYAPFSSVSIGRSAVLTGCFIGNSVDVDRLTSVTWSQCPGLTLPGKAGTISIVPGSWQESW